MSRDVKLFGQDLVNELSSEISKVFYLNETEVIELEMPLIVDVTRLMSGKIIVTTQTIYPTGKFVSLDLVISVTKYSIIGRIKNFKIVNERFYEITIMIDDVPESLLIELEGFC